MTLAILSLAAFAGQASSLANQLAFEVQGKVYRKTPLEMSYSVCRSCSWLVYLLSPDC